MCFLGLVNPLRNYMVNEAEISTPHHQIPKSKIFNDLMQILVPARWGQLPAVYPELGLFTSKSGEKKEVKLQKFKMLNGRQTLIIASKMKPSHVSIDPRLLLLYSKSQDQSGLVKVK